MFYLMFIMLLATATPGGGEQLHTAEYYASVVVDFQRLYCTGCVYLVTSDQPSEGYSTALVRTVRLLSERGVMAAQLTIKSVNRTYDAFLCQHNQPLFVIVASESDIRGFLQRLTEVFSYARWLVFLGTATSAPRLDELLANVNIPFDCEMIVAHDREDNLTIFTEVYRVHRELPLNKVVFGNWSDGRGLRQSGISLYERRNDLQGLVIRTATLNSPPVIIFKYNESSEFRELIGVSGFFGDVWTVLQERMNFKSQFFMPTDGGYGAKLANGSWNGMIALILRNEVEVAINEFSMTLDRQQAVDTMLPLIFTTNHVFIRKPTALIPRWTNFLGPFSPSLWLALVESVCVISVLLSLVYNVGRRYGNSDSAGPPRYSLPHSLFSVFACFCQQGDDITPRSPSARTVHMLTGIMSIIILAAYSGGLVSDITTANTELPFTTFSGMLKDGSYKLRVLARSGKLNLLETSTEPLLQKLYSKLLAPNKDSLPTSVLLGLKEVCKKNKYAFMTAYDIALGMMEELLPCRLVPVPYAALPDAAGMILPKRSPYGGLFNFNLQYLRNSGVTQRLRLNAWAKRMPESESVFTSVTLEAVTPIFTIIAAGIMTGFLLMSAEVLGRRWWHKLKRRLAVKRGIHLRVKRRVTNRYWVRPART